MKNHNCEQVTAPRLPSLGVMLKQRSEALPIRVENGATSLAAFAATLSESEWQTRLPNDARKVGVVVHHVASMYPIERDAVASINRDHAKQYDKICKEAALALLKTNSGAAAAAIRAFADEDLDRAAAVSLNRDALLTCQFFLEGHAVRYSYHHLARIKAAVAG